MAIIDPGAAGSEIVGIEMSVPPVGSAADGAGECLPSSLLHSYIGVYTSQVWDVWSLFELALSQRGGPVTIGYFCFELALSQRGRPVTIGYFCFGFPFGYHVCIAYLFVFFI